MGKLRTLDEYLAKHEFLRATANFNLQLERTFADVEPLDLPTRDEFSTKILDAVEPLTNLPRKLSETFLRQESSDEVLMRKNFWAAVDKLWHWRRVGCPYCGNVDLERIHIIEVDGKRTIRPDVFCHRLNGISFLMLFLTALPLYADTFLFMYKIFGAKTLQ